MKTSSVRPSKFGLAIATLLGTLHGSCSGEVARSTEGTGGTGSDASTDAMHSEPDSPGPRPEDEAPVQRDADLRSDVAIEACTPGDEPKRCNAVITGCPTVGVCDRTFGFFCPCAPCQFPLEPSACSWTLEGERVQVGRSFVTAVTDGQTRSLTQWGDIDVCQESGGFFITGAPGKVIVTLCPASCLEHQGNPALAFSLGRGGCPIM
jgi:hypothetical protein